MRPKHLDRLPQEFHDRRQIVQGRPNKNMKGEFAFYDRLGNIQQILCRSCPAILATLVQHGDVVQRRIQGTPTIIETVRMKFSRVTGHAQIVMEMEDGSKHISSMCRACAHRVQDADLEEIYLSDLESMAFVDESLGVNLSMVQHIYNQMATRIPKRLLGIEQEVG